MKSEYKEQQITLEELNNLKKLINIIDEEEKKFSLTRELIEEKEEQIKKCNSKKNVTDK